MKFNQHHITSQSNKHDRAKGFEEDDTAIWHLCRDFRKKQKWCYAVKYYRIVMVFM